MMPRITVHRLSVRALITAASGMAVVLVAIAATSSLVRTIDPDLIGSTAAVPMPILTAGDAWILPDAIASTSSMLVPALTVAGAEVIAPDPIASASGVLAPAITVGSVGIMPATIPATSGISAPTVAARAVSVAPATIPSTASALPPTIAPGQISVRPATIASTSIVQAPAISAPVSYDSDAQAYFAAMTVQPTAARKQLISDLITGHKADGDWAGLDRYALLAAHTAQAGLLDMRNPAKSASAQNGPTFTVDRGFTGDGVTAYIDLGENPLAAGNQATLTNVTIGGWINQQSGTNGAMPLFGQFGTGVRLILIPNNIADETFRVGTISSGVFMATNGSRLGHRTMTRRDDTTQFGFFNGVLVSTDARVTTGAGSVFYVLRNNTSYSGDRASAVYTGTGITPAAAARIHARLNTFLTAIGAN